MRRSLPQLEYNPDRNEFRSLRLREAKLGGFHFRKYSEDGLYLPEEEIQSLFAGRMSLNEGVLRRRFPGWAEFPAAARLGLHLLAWACGPAFRFPMLADALDRRVFAEYRQGRGGEEPVLVGGAAVECKISEAGNLGVVPRNALMRRLFEEAEASKNMRLDPDALFYPNPIIASSSAREGDSTPPIAVPSFDEVADTQPATPAFGTLASDFTEAVVKDAEDAIDARRGAEGDAIAGEGTKK